MRAYRHGFKLSARANALTGPGDWSISTRIREDVEAMSVTYTIMAASMLAWGLLIALVWAF